MPQPAVAAGAPSISHKTLSARLVAMGWSDADRHKISLIQSGNRKLELVEFLQLAHALDIAPSMLLTHVDRSLLPPRRLRSGARIEVGTGVALTPVELRQWLRGAMALPAEGPGSAERRERFYGYAGQHLPGWFRPDVFVEMEDEFEQLRQAYFDGKAVAVRVRGDQLKAAVDRSVELMIGHQALAARGAFDGEL